jgi:N-methylhydantoinase A
MLVPADAGVGSAIGFLRAPFSFEAIRSVYVRLATFDAQKIQVLLNELREEATRFVRSCAPAGTISCTFKVYMRYIGQGWEIPVTLTAAHATAPDARAYLKAFETEYTALFGRTVAGLDTEITVWSANATTDITPPAKSTSAPKRHTMKSPTNSGTRRLFDTSVSAFVPAPVYARDAITHDQLIHGPAVITEAETTIIVPAGFDAMLRSDGTIDINRIPAGAKS